jgi:hypothetical protein
MFLFHLLEFSDVEFDLDIDALNARWDDFQLGAIAPSHGLKASFGSMRVNPYLVILRSNAIIPTRSSGVVHSRLSTLSHQLEQR